jgi:hypothetical protein
MNKVTADELQSIIDDVKATITETKFVARWVLVEGYHKIGERLQGVKNDREILSRVTINTGVKERNLYRAIQFYEMYPDLNQLPEGKDTSWHKICNEYLPEPKDKEPEPELCTCPTCGKEHKKA